MLYPAELRTQVYELLSNRAKAPNAFIVYQIREQNANVFLKNLKNSMVKCNNFLPIFLYILSHHNKAVNIHSFVGSLL